MKSPQFPSHADLEISARSFFHITLRLTLVMAFLLTIGSTPAFADGWKIRGGASPVYRTESGDLTFGNGVYISATSTKIQIIFPNWDRIVLDRTPKNDTPFSFRSNQTVDVLRAGEFRHFGPATLDKFKIFINQGGVPSRRDFLSLIHGLFFSFADSTTLTLIDPYGPNHTQSIKDLPQHIQDLLLSLMKFHEISAPPYVQTNIFTTEQLNAIPLTHLSSRATSTTIASSKISASPRPFGNEEAEQRRARLSTESLAELSPYSKDQTPECCCPDGKNGRKKKKVYYLAGTFQAESKEPHLSFSRMSEYFKDSPCVEIVNFLWSAWSCFGTSSEALAKAISKDVNSNDYCGVDAVGYSGGGTVVADAGTKINRERGSTTPVNLTTLGAPFSGSPGFSELTWLFTILPPGGLPLGELVGLAPCGAVTIAQGVDVAAATDPLTTTTLWYSEADSMVPPSVARNGGPEAGPRVEYKGLVIEEHNEILNKVIDTFHWNNCCGNGAKEKGEDCEPKGGLCKDADGRPALCTASCKCPKLCGNGIREISVYPGGNMSLPMVRIGEECDPPNAPSIFCPGPDGLGKCGNDCKCLPVCGDGILQPPETCEKGVLSCTDTPPAGFEFFCAPDKCACEKRPKPEEPSGQVISCNGQSSRTPPECVPGQQCTPRGPGGSGSGTCNSECKCIDNCVGEHCLDPNDFAPGQGKF